MDRTFENLLSHMNGIYEILEREAEELNRQQGIEASRFADLFESLDPAEQDQKDIAYRRFCMFRGMKAAKLKDAQTLRVALSFYQDV